MFNMLYSMTASVSPNTGNVSANVYLIVVIIAGVLVAGAIAARIISKNKKKKK